MNFRSLLNNVTNSLRTTKGPINALKKLLWLYRISPAKSIIQFNYPDIGGYLKLAVRNNEGSDRFILNEVFEQQCYHIKPSIQVNRILDLGANAGFTAVYFSRIFPGAAIACVEPIPANVSLLRENLAMNKISANIFEAAVAISSGKITMELGDKDYGHKVHDIPFGRSISEDTIEVRALTINELLSELQWPTIDLLKVDIEGYEGILFKDNNAWLTLTKTIMMETHEGIDLDELRGIFTSFGFTNETQYKGIWMFSRININESNYSFQNNHDPDKVV